MCTYKQQTMCILSDCAVRIETEVVLATIIDPERCTSAQHCRDGADPTHHPKRHLVQSAVLPQYTFRTDRPTD